MDENEAFEFNVYSFKEKMELSFLNLKKKMKHLYATYS